MGCGASAAKYEPDEQPSSTQNGDGRKGDKRDGIWKGTAIEEGASRPQSFRLKFAEEEVSGTDEQGGLLKGKWSGTVEGAIEWVEKHHWGEVSFAGKWCKKWIRGVFVTSDSGQGEYDLSAPPQALKRSYSTDAVERDEAAREIQKIARARAARKQVDGMIENAHQATDGKWTNSNKTLVVTIVGRRARFNDGAEANFLKLSKKDAYMLMEPNGRKRYATLRDENSLLWEDKDVWVKIGEAKPEAQAESVEAAAERIEEKQQHRFSLTKAHHLEAAPWDELQKSMMDGGWTNPNGRTVNISGYHVDWPNGDAARLRMVSELKDFKMKLHGKQYTAQLIDFRLVWNDGDVWTPEANTRLQLEVAQRRWDEVRKRRRSSDEIVKPEELRGELCDWGSSLNEEVSTRKGSLASRPENTNPARTTLTALDGTGSRNTTPRRRRGSDDRSEASSEKFSR